MSNIYYRLHFMVSELYGNSIVNNRYHILDMVDKIHKDPLNEPVR